MREGKIGQIQSPLQADLDGIAEDVVETLGVDIALFSLTHNTQLVSLGLGGNIGRTREDRFHVPSDLVCLHVIENNSPLVLSDARVHPDFKDVAYVANGTVTGYLGVPVENAEVGAIGAICAVTSSPREWSSKDMRFLRTVSSTIENLILREMYRLECADVSSLVSEYDQIIAAFSLVRAAPTSIHDRDGRLVFANKALTEFVPDADLQREDIKQVLMSPLSEEPLRVDIDRNAYGFYVRRSETSSGYIVCQWTAVPTNVH